MSTLDRLRVKLAENNTQTLQALATSLGVTPSRIHQLCVSNNLVRIQPRSQAAMTRQKTVNIPPLNAQWVLDEAKRTNKSQNAVINRMISFYIEHHGEDTND